MDLRISHSDADGASAGASRLLPLRVASLEDFFALNSVRVGDDAVDGGLRSVGLTKGDCWVGHALADSAALGLLTHLQVVIRTVGTVSLIRKKHKFSYVVKVLSRCKLTAALVAPSARTTLLSLLKSLISGA